MRRAGEDTQSREERETMGRRNVKLVAALGTLGVLAFAVTVFTEAGLNRKPDE